MTDKSPIAVITDSTCNIPPELVKQYNIYLVLQHLIWGTEDLLDLKDISSGQFYDRLPRDPIHPKTSQPPASEFAEVIEQAVKDGAKEAVVLTVSAPLSGTNGSAVQAKEMVDIPVTVVDSRSAGMGLGWQVLAAARARDAGADVSGMVAAADKVRASLLMLLMVDTLEYLHKGGRIGGAQKLIGTALNLKPRLQVNPVSGLVESVERTRTRNKAIEGMYQAYFEKQDKSKPMHVAVHHTAALKDAEQLAERIRNEHKPAELVIVELTPVLGVHTGPGLLAITGYTES
jgi:DegV family protein with EDD domain